MGAFAVCQACRRHIKASEACCPFCNVAREPAATTSRGPAAGFAAVAVTAVALAGCGPRTEPAYGVPQDVVATDERAQPAYGIPQDAIAPPPDAGADVVATDERGQPAYGIPQDN